MKLIKKPLEKLKSILLKYVVGYRDPMAYWDKRWKLGLDKEKWSQKKTQMLLGLVNNVMAEHSCSGVLEVGCGAAHLRSLAGYVGLDFSVEALVKSGLKEYVYADVTRHIPYPDKSFDSVLCMSVLMHIPPDKVGCAVSEISRVARSLVMLWEPRYQQGKTFQPHTFNHDLISLFTQHFSGKVVFIGEGDDVESA